MALRAILFDTLGTVVDWRSSLTADFQQFGERRGRPAAMRDAAVMPGPRR